MDNIVKHFQVAGAILEETFEPLPRIRSAGEQNSALQNGLNALFLILGAVSLLVITIAGLRYVISHGDSRVIEESKNAILYAIIGLIVSILAFTIVNFVLGRV